MVRSFVDSHGEIAHAAFQEWRRKHSRGFFLNRVGKSKVMVHLGACRHFRDCLWECSKNGLYSLTKRPKITASSLNELKAWAANEGISLRECAGCKPFDSKD